MSGVDNDGPVMLVVRTRNHRPS